LYSSIEKCIEDVAKALSVGVHPDIARLAIISEGYHIKRANIILRWAQRMITQNKGI
jgi:hypothetical protein